MSTVSTLWIAGAALVGALGGGLAIWLSTLLVQLRRERERERNRMTELESRVTELSKSKREELDDIRLTERQVSYNESVLFKTIAKDALDGLMQRRSTVLMLEALRESGVMKLLEALADAGMLK